MDNFDNNNNNNNNKKKKKKKKNNNNNGICIALIKGPKTQRSCGVMEG